MSLCSYLRKIENQPPLLLALLKQHKGSEIVALGSQTRFVCLVLRSAQNVRAQALLDVDLWLNEMIEQLPELPWQEVPLCHLLPWLKKRQLHFWIEEQYWEVVDIRPCPTPLPEKSLLLVARPCTLHCLDWPVSEQKRHDWWKMKRKIPFQLRFVLGSSQLRLTELMDITLGDLLLIKRSDAFLVVGERRLNRFRNFSNKEVIVEHQCNGQQEAYRQDDESLDDWGSLPVEIEFVLDSQTVTLAELEEIQVGARLTLAPGVEQKIKVFINRKLFACGELVALENGPLAVEVNHIRQSLMNEREHFDDQ
ncbi:FliM/FliN family flagellar motor switch protein [Tatumella ptyseos]|uniref:FliM/FliN family flagellar motor switch protein n=1 Tax=Tatumella ptyseos TaxID=82987 RepID=UPI0026EE3B49|nr:FliM/FliN family flagellar motor switch protein [Tatumella ptyseos]WKX25755.1 FliM/FliN family flagellar motor switch protein [Tatumella ptyseos]